MRPGTSGGLQAAWDGATLRRVVDSQAKNPLHGLTLETIVTRLVEHYGFAALGELVPIHCFQHEPSVRSSLKFLRRMAWARSKVEALYLSTCASAGWIDP